MCVDGERTLVSPDKDDPNSRPVEIRAECCIIGTNNGFRTASRTIISARRDER